MKTEKIQSHKKLILEKVFWVTLLIVVIISICLFVLSEAPKIYTIIDGEQVTKDYYSINEIVVCDDEEISVTNIQEKTNKNDKSISKGEKLVAITYRIKNNSDNEEGYYLTGFNVVTSNGEIVEPQLGAFTSMWDGEFFKGVELAPGGTKEGYFVYSLKEDENDYYTQYLCSYNLDFSKTYVKIKP